MRRSLAVVLSACVFMIAAPPARAQQAPLPSTPLAFSPPPDRLSAAQSLELDAWLRAMSRWERDDKRWHNEPAHDPFGRIIKRALKPEAPVWLDARCALLSPGLVASMPGRVGSACRLLAGVEADPSANAIRASTATQRKDAERTVKDSFLTRVHIDGLWTTTSTDVRMYGIVGSHISLVDVGRIQFFGPPGVIVLTVPDGRGSRQIKTGYTWGMSVRLRDVRLFSPTRNMTLFLTLSKVWLTGGLYDRLARGGFDIAGFSLAPKRSSK